MYSPSMIESIRRLEASRPFRMKETLSAMSPQEKQATLEKYHPDYKKGMMRPLAVGPNRGGMMPKEVADLLESYSRLDPERFDLSRIDYDADVLIVGAGGAGSSAALIAAEAGAKVLMATKLRFGEANTMMAQGGIQAADKENDSPALHYLDVMGGGGFHNRPALVRALVLDAPIAIRWLEGMGMMFDKEPDGTMTTIHGGGTCRKRMHSARDYSGGEIMKTLRDEVKNRGIEVLEYTAAVELLTDGETCTGAVLFNLETNDYALARAKTVIVATGGCGRLHIQGFPCTNHYGATADGLVVAYRAGCPMAFMDTIQYHPTGAAYPEQILGQLVTEKVRGLGGQMVNDEGKRFIYELETRDLEAAAIIRECGERKKGVVTPSGRSGIWLDSPLIDILHGPGTIQKKLPAMHRQYQRFGIDMTKEPILIYPTQHYQNGGVEIDERCRTALQNLYVAGEASGGVHGRNRLMGNSLLDIIVFGRRAGWEAGHRAASVKPGRLSLDHVKKYHRALAEAKVPPGRVAPILLPDYRHTA